MIQWYADRMSELVLRKGVNLKKGQCLNIKVGYKSVEYASVMAAKAYEFGAKYVHIDVDDPRVLASRSLYQKKSEDLEYVPLFVQAMETEFAAEEWAFVRIDSGEERVNKTESNLNSLQKITKAMRMARKVSSKKLMANEISWCVTVCPGPLWAKQILGDDANEEDLAKLLSQTLRIDTEDYLKRWDIFDKEATRRCEYLNSLNIEKLHYTSPVTDFTVGLKPFARFCGGAADLPDKSRFFANLPTEEIFTTPDKDSASGFIKTTRVVSVMNHDTEGVTLHFEKGKVTHFTAEKGKEIMEKYLETDEGASRLGEVALVDAYSPISSTGVNFGSILIDENASCHIALGDGYPECLMTEKPMLTDKDKAKNGCNNSLVHTDFMVGSKDLDIVAITRDGKEIKIMDKGRFKF